MSHLARSDTVSSMFIGFKVHTRAVPVVISNGLRAAISLECLRHTGRRSVLHAYSYIQQSGRNLKSMTAKNTKKSPIHGNAEANITCEFGDGDISRSRSWFPHTRTHARTHAHTHARTHAHTHTHTRTGGQPHRQLEYSQIRIKSVCRC